MLYEVGGQKLVENGEFDFLFFTSQISYDICFCAHMHSICTRISNACALSIKSMFLYPLVGIISEYLIGKDMEENRCYPG